MIDFDVFEAFEEENPDRLLDESPDKKYVALQVPIGDVYPAAVWSTETKSLVWSPENAYGLAWLQEGVQIAALQQNAFPSEDFRFALYSWPQCHLLQQYSLRFPLGYLFDLTISPTNDLAVCQWIDQCEFGFEFINIRDNGLVHLTQHSYINKTTNLPTRPVFHPNGRLWICAYQDNTSWWVDENTRISRNKPAKGGKREKIGALMVFYQTQLLGEIPLIVTVPDGYRPSSLTALGFFAQETKKFDSAPPENGHLSDPVFTDIEHVIIHLPSGETPVYDLSKFLHEKQ